MSVYPELIQAAELIEINGWVQGRASGARGEMCVWEAISHADFPYERRFRAKKALALAVGRSIPDWNDDGRRTKASVIRTLRRVGETGE